MIPGNMIRPTGIQNNNTPGIASTNNVVSQSKIQNDSRDAFSKILSDKIDKIEDGRSSVQFSKHAEMRLAKRDINLSGEQLQRIENGVLKAREKGIRDSLVMVDDVALVVNVRNKVVITAMDNNGENVFTNIDGAVIV